MFISNTLLVVISLFVGQVFSAYNCIKCSGTHHVAFAELTNQPQATTFFKASIGACASGGDIVINQVTPQACDYATKLCTSYIFTITVNSYCGTRGSVAFNKKKHCINGKCSTTDTLSLKCAGLVACKGKCSPRGC